MNQMLDRVQQFLAWLLLLVGLVVLALACTDAVQWWRSWEARTACQREKGPGYYAHRKPLTTEFYCSW